MSVQIHRASAAPGAPVVGVTLVGLTPGFDVHFVADEPPALYIDAGGTDGLAVGADLPALIDALGQLAHAYGYDLTSAAPAAPTPREQP